MILLVLYLVTAAALLLALEVDSRRRRRAHAHRVFLAQLQAWLGAHGDELTPWQRQFLEEMYHPDSNLLRQSTSMLLQRRRRR